MRVGITVPDVAHRVRRPVKQSATLIFEIHDDDDDADDNGGASGREHTAAAAVSATPPRARRRLDLETEAVLTAGNGDGGCTVVIDASLTAHLPALDEVEPTPFAMTPPASPRISPPVSLFHPSPTRPNGRGASMEHALSGSGVRLRDSLSQLIVGGARSDDEEENPKDVKTAAMAMQRLTLRRTLRAENADTEAMDVDCDGDMEMEMEMEMETNGLDSEPTMSPSMRPGPRTIERRAGTPDALTPDRQRRRCRYGGDGGDGAGLDDVAVFFTEEDDTARLRNTRGPTRSRGGVYASWDSDVDDDGCSESSHTDCDAHADASMKIAAAMKAAATSRRRARRHAAAAVAAVAATATAAEMTATLRNGDGGVIGGGGALETYRTGGMVWSKGELLGQGAYGKVYAALNQTTGELMAVKQLKIGGLEFGGGGGDDAAARALAAMEREVLMCSKVSKPRERKVTLHIPRCMAVLCRHIPPVITTLILTHLICPPSSASASEHCGVHHRA